MPYVNKPRPYKKEWQQQKDRDFIFSMFFAVSYVTKCMQWRPKWAQTLPLTCEVGYGVNYGKS